MAGWQDTPYGEVWVDDDGLVSEPPQGGQYPSGQPTSGYTPSPQPPTQPPAPVIPPAVPAPAPGQRQGGNAGYSVEYTPQDRVDQLAGAAQRDMGAAEQWGEAQYGNIAKPLIDAEHEARQRVMSDADYASAPSEAAVTATKLNRQAKLQAGLSELYGQFQRDEQAAAAAGAAHVEKEAATYKSMVQQFAAMRVNPGQWWANLSGGQQAGTMAAVFAANFLGMKGRPSTVMATINQAIDQNIRAQEYNIQTAGTAAGMYKQVYEMAVAQSATAAEARERLRGFHLAQVNNEIAAELARYDAPLAMAKFAEARAALDGELEQNLLKVREYVGNRVQAIQNNARSLRETEMHVAAQRYSAKLGYDAEMARIQAASTPDMGKAVSALNEVAVTDPFTGQIIGKARTKEDGQRIRQENSGAYQIGSLALRVRNLIQKNGEVYGGDWGKMVLNDEDAREVRAVRAALKQQYALRMTGKASNATEQALFDESIPLDTWTTNGSVNHIYNGFIQREIANTKVNWAGQLAELSPQDKALVDQGYVQSGLMADPMPAIEAATYETPPVASGADKTIEAIRAPDSNDDAIGDYPASLSRDWAEMRVKFPDAPADPPMWFAEAVKGVRDAKVAGEAEQLDALLDAYAKESDGVDGGDIRQYAVQYLRDRLGVTSRDLNVGVPVTGVIGVDPSTVVED